MNTRSQLLVRACVNLDKTEHHVYTNTEIGSVNARHGSKNFIAVSERCNWY